MTTINAQSIIDAINTAALVAPEHCPHLARASAELAIMQTKQFNAPYGFELEHCEEHEIIGASTWNRYDNRAKPNATVQAQYMHLFDGLHMARMNEELHALPAVDTPRTITFKTSARGTMKIKNLRANLEKFAASVRSNAAAFGGGLVRAKRTKASTWSASAARAVRQLLEDGDYLGAYDMATAQCGAMFYSHNGDPFMVYCPTECEELPGLLVGQHERGHFVAFESYYGGRAFTSQQLFKTRARAIEDAKQYWDNQSEERRALILASAQAKKQDQTAARAEWLTAHGITAADDLSARIEAQAVATNEAMESEAAAASVAAVVASAAACAAIEKASEATAQKKENHKPALLDLLRAGFHPVVAECIARDGLHAYGPAAVAEILEKLAALGDIATTAPAPALAECVATECTTTAAHASEAAALGGHTAGHASTTPERRANSALPVTTQVIKGKSGHWSAHFFTDTLGRASMVFMGEHGAHDPQYFDNGAERMRALQKMASAADTAATTSEDTTKRAPRAYTLQNIQFDLRGITWKIEVSRYWKIDNVPEKQHPYLLGWTAYKRGGRYALQHFTRVPCDNIPRDVAARAAAFFEVCNTEDKKQASTSTAATLPAHTDTPTPTPADTPSAAMDTTTTGADYTTSRETSPTEGDKLHDTPQDLQPVEPTSEATSASGALSITITRGEGLTSECGRPVTVASFAAANALLHQWSETAPKAGRGYDKCNFIITWPNGSTYDGRYYLKHHTAEPASLTAHMVDSGEFYTGKNCPAHMSAAAYDDFLARVDDGTRAAYAEILQTMASLGEYFPRQRPVAIDLRAFLAEGLKPADLVGYGVTYCGGMDDNAGAGAIVSAEPCTWAGVRVTVQLEDGRQHTATGAQFGDKAGDRYRLDFKRHGAPYLAQLAAAYAAAKAQRTSAEELEKQNHAAALVRLAAEFPQLKRAEGRNMGGKLAAINARILLKENFPGIKFSVKSDFNSLTISWTGGPTDKELNAIIGRFDIGASDTQTDYFYTVSTAFSELFGGAQYVNTYRTHTEQEISAALVVMYGDNGPSVEDWTSQKQWDAVPHGNCAADFYRDPWAWLSDVRRYLNGNSY